MPLFRAAGMFARLGLSVLPATVCVLIVAGLVGAGSAAGQAIPYREASAGTRSVGAGVPELTLSGLTTTSTVRTAGTELDASGSGLFGLGVAGSGGGGSGGAGFGGTGSGPMAPVTRASPLPGCLPLVDPDDVERVRDCLNRAAQTKSAALFEAVLSAATPEVLKGPDMALLIARGYLYLNNPQACIKTLRAQKETDFSLLLTGGYCRLVKGDALIASLLARRATDYADTVEEIHEARTLYRRSTANRMIDLNLNLQVYPTTNENRATSTEMVRLFGLPFQVNETQEGGVRVSGTADLTVRPKLSLFRDRRFFPFLATSVRYDNNLFGQTFVQGQLRPGMVFSVNDNQEAIAFYVAGRAYLAGTIVLNEQGLGTSLRTRHKAQTTELSASVRWQDYVELQAQATQATLTYANKHAWKYDELTYSLGLQETLSKSFLLDKVTILGHLGYKRLLFDQAIVEGLGHVAYSAFRQDDPVFGARQDLNSTMEGRVTPVHYSLFGLSPSLFIRHIRQDSNLSIYDTRASEAGLDLRFLL